MPEEPDYIVDIGGIEGGVDNVAANDPADPAGGEPADRSGPVDLGRRWIGVHFDCCGVYTRIYRHPTGTAYVGHCPRCRRPVHIPIGPDGTDARMFRAQ